VFSTCFGAWRATSRLRRSRPTPATIPGAAGRQQRAGDGVARAGAKRILNAESATMRAYVRRAGAPIGSISATIFTLVCVTAEQERRARCALRERALRPLEVQNEEPNRMAGRGNRSCSSSSRTRGIHVL
jgi:hypothetical protein